MPRVSRSLSVLAELKRLLQVWTELSGYVIPPVHITGKIGELAGRSGINIVVEFFHSNRLSHAWDVAFKSALDFPQRQCALIGVILVGMPAQAHRSPIPQHQDRLGLDVGVGEIEGLTVWRKHSFGGEFKVKTGGAAYLFDHLRVVHDLPVNARPPYHETRISPCTMSLLQKLNVLSFVA